MATQPEQGTFAAAAMDGVYYVAACSKCRREVLIAAVDLVAAGHGHEHSVGFQARLRCRYG